MHSHSLYQATKSSIQQGIIQLQQKLLQKKQLDLQTQITRNLLQDQTLYRQQQQLKQLQRIYHDNLQYNHALLLRTASDPYSSNILHGSYLNDPASLAYLEHLQNRRREISDIEYLKRLERLKEQSIALQSRATNGYRAQMHDDKIKNYSSPIQQFTSHRNSPGQSRGHQLKRSPPRHQHNSHKKLQYDLPLEQDSSALIEKYNKGIRAQEYNREMERLIEIQKKLRIMEQNPSASKSYTPQGNQSIVMPYQLVNFNEKNQFGSKNQQRSNQQYNQTLQNRVHQGSRNIVNKEQQGSVVPVQAPAEHLDKIRQQRKDQIFENEKIGEVINKKKNQEIPKDQHNSSQKYPQLDNLDNFIKKAQKRHPLNKPVSLNRPYTSKSRNAGYREVSRSLTSALSPLKSERVNNRYSYTGKRQRAKSSKPNNSSRTNNNNISILKAKQINSRLLALNPDTQKVFEDILRKQINQKIQNRLQLLTCVFKDAKLRHERNEIEALTHRFEIEAKGRREVKSMINNDPKILKKHKMVVE